MKLLICLLILFLIVNKLFCQNIDIDLLRDINASHPRLMDKSAQMISNSITPVLIAAPIVMYVSGRLGNDPETYQRVTLILSAIATSSLLTTSLKNGFNRTRPFDQYPDINKLSTGGSGSFPSGHTSSAFTVATSLSLAYPKWYVIAPAMTWASMVGYSRMYLGVHYPSDVFAGAVIGSGSALLSNYLNKKVFNKHRQRKFPPLDF